MEHGRNHRVQLDAMNRSRFVCLVLIFLASMAALTAMGVLGPPVLTQKTPTKGANITLASDSQQCNANGFQQPVVPGIPSCWNHIFRFHHVWTQYFIVEAMVNRADGDTAALTKKIHMDVIWNGTRSEEERTTDWTQIARSKLERSVVCNEGSKTCEPFILIKATSVEYVQYYFQVQLTSAKADLDFVDSVTFSFTYRNHEFSVYELAFKAVFAAFTLIIIAVYMRRTWKRELRQTYEQRWALYLLWGLFFFNNPFFVLEYLMPGSLFGILSVVLQFNFMALIMLYWLIIYDGLRRSPPFSLRRFYLPKLCFVGVYWLIGAIVYSWVKYETWNAPLYNWYEDTSTRDYIQGISLFICITYFIWLANLLRHGLRELRAIERRHRWLYAFHLLVTVIMLSGMIAGGIIGTTVDTSTELLVFHALFNLYVYTIAYLYMPLAHDEQFSILTTTADGNFSLEEEEGDIEMFRASYETAIDEDDSDDDATLATSSSSSRPKPYSDKSADDGDMDDEEDEIDLGFDSEEEEV